jgi:hypothetical protein
LNNLFDSRITPMALSTQWLRTNPSTPHALPAPVNGGNQHSVSELDSIDGGLERKPTTLC